MIGKSEVGSRVVMDLRRNELMEGREGRGESAGMEDWRAVMKVLSAVTEGSFCTGPSLAMSFSSGGSLVQVTGFSCKRCKVGSFN